MSTHPASEISYFVDEAGDPTLFGRNGRVLIGTVGCSRYFLLGLVQIKDYELVEKEICELRQSILSDPYFSNVPSVSLGARKTALYFHAKDDLPEIRREVFKLLNKHEIKVNVVVKDKFAVYNYIKQRQLKESEYKYREGDLYDFLIRRLFRDKLHTPEKVKIIFSKRGLEDRYIALKQALGGAITNFEKKWSVPAKSEFEVISAYPTDFVGLQVVDYYLWAIQR